MTALPAGGPAAPQHHAIALPAGTRLGEFEVTSTIGEGGFGIVYLAWDHSLERKVALKEYMPSSIAYRDGTSEIRARGDRHQETFDAGMKSFINEAKLLAQFDHPSLLKVYRFWEANGTAYMVMPFLEGTTLRDTVRGLASPPDEAWLISLLNPVCDALVMLHAAQVYHRDIAPDNILLLAENGRPLLLDFGAARRVIGDMTQALTAILKPGYAPIEQYAEMPGMKQGPWTDVYALAAVVHWMILGKTPTPSVGRLFDDAHVPLAQSARGRYSERFLQAIDRGLAVTPDKRTQSIEAFRADLLGTSSAPPTIVAAPAAAPAAASATAAAAAGMPAMRTVQTLAPTVREPRPADETTRLDARARQRPAALPEAAPGTADDAAPRRTPRRTAIAAAVVLAVAAAAGLLWLRQKPAAETTATTPPIAQPEAAPATRPEPASAAQAAASGAVAGTAETAATPQLGGPDTAASGGAPLASGDAASSGLPATQQTPRADAAQAMDREHKEAKPASKKASSPRADTRDRRAETTAAPRTTESRAAEAKPADSDANANRSECARLFQRLSIGDTDQALIDRIRTLRCR